jgi:hypothetical protein
MFLWQSGRNVKTKTKSRALGRGLKKNPGCRIVIVERAPLAGDGGGVG